MLVRSASLPESMSRYLIDRIEGEGDRQHSVSTHTHTEIIALYGSPEGQLERVRWRNNTTGEETEKQMRNLFLFIGVDPATCWLRGCGSAKPTMEDKRQGITPKWVRA
jgi:thioredoxin reductase (NADPH)